MRPSPGQLERSLAAITIGVQQRTVLRSRQLAERRTGEYDQQVRVDINGSAGNDWGYADAALLFEYPFLYAPAQRRVPFNRPHFSYGFEIAQPLDTLLHLGAQIVGWNVNENGWIIGATVRVHVIAPQVTQATPFAATAHLTFQGYAANAEGDDYSI